jgi:signal transduction histidine kinase
MDALQFSLSGMEAEERVQVERRDTNLKLNLAQVRRGAEVASALNLMLVALGAGFLVMELRRRKLEQTEASRRAGELERVVAERTSQLSGLSQFLQRFQEVEKARIAHDLHDELGGTLAAAKIDLEMLSAKLPAGHGQEARIARLVLAIDDAVQVKRRIIEDLRPTILDNLGIAAALRWQCDQFSKRIGRPCHVEIEEGDLALPVDYGIAFYRIVQEALTNVSKYANAKQVAVLLRREAGQWLLQVSDDGVGFDPAKPRNRTAHGLLSMRERARALGGDLAIESVPGRGTVLYVRVPLQAPPAPGNSAPVGPA